MLTAPKTAVEMNLGSQRTHHSDNMGAAAVERLDEHTLVDTSFGACTVVVPSLGARNPVAVALLSSKAADAVPFDYMAQANKHM